VKALTREEESHGLRIAPLIDVVFLLLIFFLVATTFYEAEKDITLRLAQAAQGEDREQVSDILVVNVRRSGVIVVREEVKTLAQLEQQLRTAKGDDPNVAVVVRCDRHAHYKHFIRVLDLCEKVGVTGVAIAVLQSE
jgi:biopolymer transport protein ExbD